MLLSSVEESGIPFDRSRMIAAFEYAKDLYGEEEHPTGVSILEHCVGVLQRMLQFQPDEDTVIACLLHHALERRDCTLIDLETQFGPAIRSLVSGVHLLSRVSLSGRRASIDDLRLMLLTVSDDVRTVLIILCDRLHLLEFLSTLPPDERKRVCHDVLQLFAPVAARLGIYRLKHALEDHAFPVIYPADAERIKEQFEQLRTERRLNLRHMVDAVQTYLSEQGITATMEYREKQAYSIFVKMRQKSLTHIEDIYDLFAVRVIVKTEEDCYQTLGLLHRLGRPVPNRFKDYIAFPKPNGYQSLHTTIMGLPGTPSNVLVEVQVRTHEMNREAKYGIAAHWGYKEYGSTSATLHKVQLRNMLASQQSLEDESGATAHLADHIFVLTPNGDVIELPEGATPLDFAFQVHSDLGLCFRGARVNGAVVSLDHELENGDVVEIQKYPSPRPSPQWLQLLKMASSRAKLKKYLYSQDRPRLVVEGRELINEELIKHHLPLLDRDLSLLRHMDGAALSFQQREDILMKVGQGAERASAVLPRIDALGKMDLALRTEPKRKIIHSISGKQEEITFADGVPMPHRYAKCCKPEADHSAPIVGLVNRQGEVMIHRDGCRMIRHANRERMVDVQWS